MTAQQTTFLAQSAPIAPFAAPDVPPAPPVATLEAAPLDDLLDMIGELDALIPGMLTRLNEAHAARQSLLDVIGVRMGELGARKYVGAHCVCRYEIRKSGSAAIPLPAGLRAELVASAKIPPADIDDALPMVTPPPTCKPDLRKTRKLAAYGHEVADIIDRHIVEAKKSEYLVVEPLMIDATPVALS
jgi:hypothetical protein